MLCLYIFCTHFYSQFAASLLLGRVVLGASAGIFPVNAICHVLCPEALHRQIFLLHPFYCSTLRVALTLSELSAFFTACLFSQLSHGPHYCRISDHLMCAGSKLPYSPTAPLSVLYKTYECNSAPTQAVTVGHSVIHLLISYTPMDKPLGSLLVT